ncbi:unnamed protein product, partial [Staurois parvus]
MIRDYRGYSDTVLRALGRKGLTFGAIKGLTVCCFNRETCCTEKYTAACPGRQERDLCCLHTDLPPVSFS